MSLPVSDIVQVQILVSPQAPVARGFGTGLVLGSATVLPLEERIRSYSSLVGGVDVDFNSGTEEYKAAAAYFGQTPAPSLLLIGRRFLVAQAGKLRGTAAVSGLFGAYTAITNGGFDITVNGVNRQIFGLNFSGAASMAAIATLIQTALAAALAGTTCTWSGTYFLITAPTTGPASLVGFATTPTGGSTPTDVSGMLGLTLSGGALAVAGIAIESATDSFTAARAFNPNFYGLTLTATASIQDIKDAMAWAEPAKAALFYTSNDPNALLSVATTDLFYYAKNLGYAYSVGVFSNSPYAAVSAMARAFIVDFAQPNSTITLKFKQLPGIGVDTITESQRLALEGKNANYYTSFGDFAMLANGTVANGRFFDEVHGLDWLQATLQNAVFTVLATAVSKIPQTDAGVAKLVQAAEGALRQAVANGLIAPGVWTGQNLGEVKSNDYLPNGFYTYAQPVAQQLAADRALRKSPPLSAIGCGAGAIHTVAFTFTFQR
jgi:Protein of unknown function (DUF3383)